MHHKMSSPHSGFLYTQPDEFNTELLLLTSTQNQIADQLSPTCINGYQHLSPDDYVSAYEPLPRDELPGWYHLTPEDFAYTNKPLPHHDPTTWDSESNMGERKATEPKRTKTYYFVYCSQRGLIRWPIPKSRPDLEPGISTQPQVMCMATSGFHHCHSRMQHGIGVHISGIGKLSNQ